MRTRKALATAMPAAMRGAAGGPAVDTRCARRNHGGHGTSRTHHTPAPEIPGGSSRAVIAGTAQLLLLGFATAQLVAAGLFLLVFAAGRLLGN